MLHMYIGAKQLPSSKWPVDFEAIQACMHKLVQMVLEVLPILELHSLQLLVFRIYMPSNENCLVSLLIIKNTNSCKMYTGKLTHLTTGHY